MQATFGISSLITFMPFVRMVALTALYQIGAKRWFYPPFEPIEFNTSTTGDNFNCYAHFEMAAGYVGHVEELLQNCTLHISVNGQERSAKVSGWTYQNNVRVAAFPVPYLPVNQDVVVRLLRVVDKDGIVRWSNEQNPTDN